MLKTTAIKVNPAPALSPNEKTSVLATEKQYQYKVSPAEAELSHELRTPLHMLKAFFTMGLSETLSNDDFITICAIIQHMTALTTIAPDLDRAQNKKLILNNSHFNLHDVVYTLQNMFRKIINNKPLQLNIHFKNKNYKEILIETDKLRLTQILFNLIANAIKFTSEGRIDVTLEITKQPISNNNTTAKFILHCWVKDTGMGMTFAQQQRLFQRFEQTDNNIRHTHGGSGLGLSLSKKLAQLMGGDLVVSPLLKSEGSEFHFFTNCIIRADSAALITHTENLNTAVILDGKQEKDVNIILSQEILELSRIFSQLLQPLITQTQPEKIQECKDKKTIQKLLIMINTMTRIANNMLILAKIYENKMELTPIDFNLASIITDIKNEGLPVNFHLTSPKIQNICIHADSFLFKNLLSNLIFYLATASQSAISVEINFDQSSTSTTLLQCNVRPILESKSDALTANPDTQINQWQHTIGCLLINTLIFLMGDKNTASPNFTGNEQQYNFAIACKISSQELVQQVSSTPHRKPHILIADDTVINQRILGRMLDSYQVSIANDGRAAIEIYNKYYPTPERLDVILMDLSMPILDGRDTTRNIRALEKNEGRQPTPIIAVSAKDMDSKTAQNAGFNSQITKPFSKEDIISLIKYFITLRANHNQHNSTATELSPSKDLLASSISLKQSGSGTPLMTRATFINSATPTVSPANTSSSTLSSSPGLLNPKEVLQHTSQNPDLGSTPTTAMSESARASIQLDNVQQVIFPPTPHEMKRDAPITSKAWTQEKSHTGGSCKCNCSCKRCKEKWCTFSATKITPLDPIKSAPNNNRP